VSTERDHLDAETVAAWMDGGLDNAALAAAEAHASNCERCRALLATVAKTVPEEPAVVSGFSRMRWWLAPIAATAAAVTLWMIVPREQLQQVATAPPAPEAVAPAAGARARQDAAKVIEATPPKPAAAKEQVFDESKRKAEQQTATQGKLGAAANTPPQIGAENRANKLEERVARLEAEPARAPAAAPAAPPAAARDAAAAPEEAFAQLRKQAGPALEFVSPNPNYRWRAMPNGIERSEDGGRVWLPVRLAQGEVITAGASPSPLVLWLVGRNGLVLLATDGTNFTQLPFPARVDLVRVAASEARIAVITTADGRVFRTDDAGRSWRQQ
jgi:hypothetical protein